MIFLIATPDRSGLSDDVGTSPVPDHDALRPGESVEPSTVVDDSGDKLNWNSTVSAVAKLLRGVKVGPLKSIAGDLCCILENCEVRPFLPHIPSALLMVTLANRGG